MENTNTNTIIIGLLVLIVGLIVGLSLGNRGVGASLMGGNMMGYGNMMGTSVNVDRHFIEQMIPHHEGAIAMAKIALERSKRPEIISLANGIIGAQQKEISDMRSWYQSWYGSVPPEGGAGMMRMGNMGGDPSVLNSVSALEFDREFIRQMIPHHEMAITMAQMLRTSTQRSEMKQLAGNIITSQSSEIEMMRGWLQSWYGARP
ncbi:MAG: DUF305 domain-containing protein [Patescibacteria group bacterium]